MIWSKRDMKKPGRNDPCYCGSGEKYKKCHLKIDQAGEREQRAWREAGRFLHQELMKFARDERFTETFAQALPHYWDSLYDIENADEMSVDEALRFFDWFAFDYSPAEGQRLIELYQAEKRAELSTYQQALLDQWLPADPASGYELIDYDGQILHMREFMTGKEHNVYEAGGRGNVEIGDVILARILPLNDRLEFSTTAAYLPAQEITDLAEKLRAAREADSQAYPEATQAEFMRRHNTLYIHHALAESKVQGRPPVARLNPNRQDEAAQKMARGVRRLRR
jgi:hypothetical protein